MDFLLKKSFSFLIESNWISIMCYILNLISIFYLLFTHIKPFIDSYDPKTIAKTVNIDIKKYSNFNLKLAY